MSQHTMKSILLATTLLAAIGAAQAEGMYVGGSLGTPDYKSSIDGVQGSGSGVGGKLYGGYALTPNLAIEGGLFDLGHIDDASGKVTLHGVYLDGVGRYPLATKWSVLGSAGVAEGRFSTSNGHDTSPALKLGLGLQYELSQQVALRAEYEHYHFADAFDAKANVGEVSVGIQVGF